MDICMDLCVSVVLCSVPATALFSLAGGRKEDLLVIASSSAHERRCSFSARTIMLAEKGEEGWVGV